MKYSTAVGHLQSLGEQATEGLRWGVVEAGPGWPLAELWVAGELLEGPDRLERGEVVLMLEVPPEELPWVALHPAGEWVGEMVGLRKRPIAWWYRPLGYPAWNARHRRVVRFWTAAGGLDEEVIEHLRHRRLDALEVVEPDPETLRRQLGAELAVGRRHLREVLDRYWDRDWRADHKGLGIYPEDHLWRAAEGVRQIEDALAEPLR